MADLFLIPDNQWLEPMIHSDLGTNNTIDGMDVLIVGLNLKCYIYGHVSTNKRYCRTNLIQQYR